MEITSQNGGVVTTLSTGGDQKPPIKPETEQQGTEPETTESTIVTLGATQEESPVYTMPSTGGDQKPPIKPE
jgi:hypothetical protein